jgi:hypothetical protein
MRLDWNGARMPLFDDDGKITLFVVGAAAFLLTATLDRHGPREALETALDTGMLPALPLSAQADGAPAQTPVASMQVELGDGFEARLLYGYVLEGRVVSRREFRNDATSAVSPLDLGIVYGDLAEPGATDELSFSAGPRVLWTRWDPGVNLPQNWDHQVTNNHLIPANQAINDALMAVEVGQEVRLSGYLVVVTGEEIRPWRSSTRRNDSSLIGGCEIILVTGIEVLGAEKDTAA